MAGIRAETVIVRAPVALVYCAAAALVVSVVLLLPRSLTASAAGYLLAPLVVTLIVSLFRYRDARASQSPFYSTNPAVMRIATWLVVASFAVGLLHAWIVATEIAKWFAS